MTHRVDVHALVCSCPAASGPWLRLCVAVSSFSRRAAPSDPVKRQHALHVGWVVGYGVCVAVSSLSRRAAPSDSVKRHHALHVG